MQEKQQYSKLGEKADIIIEIGFIYTRVGLANDTYPRKVLRTSTSLFPTNSQYIKQKNEQRPWDKNRILKDSFDFELKIEEFLHIIFDQELILSPKDRQIFLIYNYYQQDDIVNLTAKILFKKFETARIVFLLASVLPMYITGLFTGIVIDCGFLQTTVSPVYDGLSLLHLGGQIGLGGLDISQNLLKAIIEENPNVLQHSHAPSILYSSEWLEEVKIRVGRVLPLIASERIKTNDEGFIKKMKSVKIQIPVVSGVNVSISYYSLALAFTNSLYGDPQEEQWNLAYQFLMVVKKLNQLDVAQKLLNNVLFSGGLVLVHNFVNRFKEELNYHLENDFKDLGKVCQNLHFTMTQNNPQHLNWLGGCALSQVQLVNYHYTTLFIQSEKFTLNYQQFKDNGYLLTTKSDGYNFLSVQAEQKKAQKQEQTIQSMKDF